MAYSDYTKPGLRPISPGGYQPPTSQTQGMERMPRVLSDEEAAAMKARWGFPADGTQPAAPDASGQLPTNTRQQALADVQQAYAQPPMYQGRMPGHMDALNSALTNFAQPVGLNDPGIQPALRAGAMSDQRNFERQRQALAELLGSQNLGDSGAMNTQTLGIAQRIGEAGAARDAGLVYDEMGSRRNALLSALGMDQQRYGVDNNIALQLAQLEALLNQQAMAPFFY